MTENARPIASRRPVDDIPLCLIRQKWDQPEVIDIPSATRQALQDAGALDKVAQGQEIAITAGSRGIASKPAVLRAVVDIVREQGAVPFIFPAMGSHNGGTAEGQRAMLDYLGVNESTMGCPIRASMDVVQLGATEDGLPVVMDRIASEADGIIVVNRVKKHTNFDAPIESGLCKMMTIGMGKHQQAVTVHQTGNDGLARYIPLVATVVLDKAPILAGLAIIENAWGGLGRLVGLPPDEIVETEPALLKQALAWGAKIPFKRVDLALVEEIGKDISGTGMDCYVIGRRRIIGEPEWEDTTQIGSLVICGLTEATHGNGVGVGLGDFVTRRLVEGINWPVTHTNIMTSGNLERGKVPFTLETVRDAVEMASFRERRIPLEELRVVCIRDTLHLRHLVVSQALLPEVERRDDLELVGALDGWPWDADGNWVSPLCAL